MEWLLDLDNNLTPNESEKASWRGGLSKAFLEEFEWGHLLQSSRGKSSEDNPIETEDHVTLHSCLSELRRVRWRKALENTDALDSGSAPMHCVTQRGGRRTRKSRQLSVETRSTGRGGNVRATIR